jgi:FkbM family methyltransferase
MRIKEMDWTRELTPELPREDTCAALAPGGEVVIYGSGTIARDLAVLAQKKGLRIAAVIDANTSRTELAGRPIARPDEAAVQEFRALPLLVGIFNCNVDVPALKSRLAQLGWSRIIDFPELHAHWRGDLGDRYWLTARDFAAGHSAAIAEVDQLWADETSRELYRGMLRFRTRGDERGMGPSSVEDQYFAPDLPPWKTPLRLIDCGAFDGDTLREIDRRGLDVEAIALLEPDPENYRALLKALREVQGHRAFEAIALPCGAWSETRLLSFESDQGGGSALHASGRSVIQCLALDDALAGFRPNLIKMDIEGAETEALQGAQSLIRRERPGLAVCVYHRPADLWSIPRQIREWDLGYRFYLRLHRFNGFDAVLYAVPA